MAIPDKEGLIEVRIRLFGAIQMKTRWSDESIFLRQKATVAELLQVLYEKDPGLQSMIEGKERALSALMLVNFFDIKRKEGLNTVLSHGDQVDVISMISGG
ncbi:MoaD/ThiS family protein [Ammoniphilus sp. YIM 78166]|uniref:MoaD/ThiS family protein n=1 Tax=Ammoniphilus sp. YIM 78166 TaxID=1644106 RepID=UPI0014322E92|nr:MoaD/ThiS family protein [Ammoniphilus sp. YIM 78166]